VTAYSYLVSDHSCSAPRVRSINVTEQREVYGYQLHRQYRGANLTHQTAGMTRFNREFKTSKMKSPPICTIMIAKVLNGVYSSMNGKLSKVVMSFKSTP